MNTTKLLAAAMVMIGLPVLWTPGSAQAQTFELGPNGMRINPPETAIEVPERPRQRFEHQGITEYEAVAAARGVGLQRLERVRQGRRGWVVAGVDGNGDDIRVVISREGEIIDVQRE